jgi:hypothetical protein
MSLSFITVNGTYSTAGYKLVNSTGDPALIVATGSVTTSNQLIIGDLANNFSSTGIFSAGGEVITLLPNGKVGIGTTSPSNKFTVSGGFITAEGAYSAGGYQLVNSSSESSLVLARGNINSSDELVFGDLYNKFTSTGIFSGGGEHITLLSNGKVGIGTTSPTEKFSVAGNISANGYITAKKVTVTQLGWSDYVFDKKYKLRSLASLESFIKQNNHLPEVPSAKEVEDKGINVGDNQALLLKKIEELTLYIIDLKKITINQQKQINKLKKITGR